MLNTIQTIREHRFAGNHFDDHEAFNQIDAFASDEKHPVAERAEALRIMCERGMGLDTSDVTDQQLLDERKEGM